MGPYVTFGQCGSFIDSQRRYALSRHSTMNSGSFFLAAIARTTSSLSPGGSVSDSMSVTNPASYSRVIRDSIELLITHFQEIVCGLVAPQVARAAAAETRQ